MGRRASNRWSLEVLGNSVKGKRSPALLTQAALRFDLTLAHLARCAAMILRLPAGDRVRFRGVDVLDVTKTGFGFLTRAHLAL